MKVDSKGEFFERREEFPSFVVPLHKAEEGVSIIFPPLYVCVLNTKLRAGGGDVGSRNVAPRVAAAFGHQHFVSCPSTHQLV